MNTKVLKRWIFFVAACILYMLVTTMDSNLLGHIFWWNTGILDAQLDGGIVLLIPPLLFGGLFLISLILIFYNKKIASVILSAVCVLYGLTFIGRFTWIYSIPVIVASAIVIVYTFSKKASIWKKVKYIVLGIGIVCIIASIVLSFSTVKVSSGFTFHFSFDPNARDVSDNNYWFIRKHLREWNWCEEGICLFPLAWCRKYCEQYYLWSGTMYFPISTGLLYFVLAAGIDLPCLKISAKKEPEDSKEKQSPIDGYFDLMIHVLLCLFAGVVWQFVWVYRTTAYLNQETKEEHMPWKKLLLCVFVPFYWVYWFYINGKRLDRLAKDNGVHKGDITTICWITALFLPIVSCVFMQERINAVCGKPNADSKDKNVTAEIKELKALLDDGYITQEEFDAKKKQLLGL